MRKIDMADNNPPGALNAQVMEFLKNKGQDMVEHFQDMQETLKRKKFSGKAGVEDEDGFYVSVLMDGLSHIEKVNIGKGALESGEKVLSDLLISAFNDLMEKYKSGVQEEVMGVYQKSGLPLEEKKEED
jgi:DNA-binding protein YbaB